MDSFFFWLAIPSLASDISVLPLNPAAYDNLESILTTRALQQASHQVLTLTVIRTPNQLKGQCAHLGLSGPKTFRQPSWTLHPTLCQSVSLTQEPCTRTCWVLVGGCDTGCCRAGGGRTSCVCASLCLAHPEEQASPRVALVQTQIRSVFKAPSTRGCVAKCFFPISPTATPQGT